MQKMSSTASRPTRFTNPAPSIPHMHIHIEDSKEATNAADPPIGLVAKPAQSVQGTQIGRTIRGFDDARLSDMRIEQQPEDNAGAALTTRLGGREVDAGGMDILIRRTLAEEREGEGEDDDQLVEKVAKRLAKGRTLGAGSRPSALKRYGT